jgi:hypothetical protein
MANYLLRMRIVAGGHGQVSVRSDDVRLLLRDRDELDKDNDELRRENERLLKALAPTMPPPAAPEPEMCCGGTCVRAVCFIHGAGNG